jgi:hypothetical protein
VDLNCKSRRILNESNVTFLIGIVEFLVLNEGKA